MPSTPILHVSYEFVRLPEDEVDNFTLGILGKLYSVAVFAGPPVSAAVLTTALGVFTQAMADMVDAGPSATAAKNDALAALMVLLRKLAAFVEEKSENDLAVLLSSGFKAASTNRAQHPLPKAVIRKVAFAGSSSLLVEAETMDNATGWEARWKPAAAPDSAYVHAENDGAKRKMTIINLPSLTQITIQMRGVGGATGYGPWSDGVTHAVT